MNTINIQVPEVRNDVRKTHWADISRESYKLLQDAIPAVVETEMTLWQRRVNNPDNKRPWLSHKYLFTFTCMRYAMRSDGVFAPVEPREELTFLVAADNRREAKDRVDAEIKVHGWDPMEWAIGSTQCPLIMTT